MVCVLTVNAITKKTQSNYNTMTKFKIGDKIKIKGLKAYYLQWEKNNIGTIIKINPTNSSPFLVKFTDKDKTQSTHYSTYNEINLQLINKPKHQVFNI